MATTNRLNNYHYLINSLFSQSMFANEYHLKVVWWDESLLLQSREYAGTSAPVKVVRW